MRTHAAGRSAPPPTSTRRIHTNLPLGFVAAPAQPQIANSLVHRRASAPAVAGQRAAGVPARLVHAGELEDAHDSRSVPRPSCSPGSSSPLSIPRLSRRGAGGLDLSKRPGSEGGGFGRERVSLSCALRSPVAVHSRGPTPPRFWSGSRHSPERGVPGQGVKSAGPHREPTGLTRTPRRARAGRLA